MALFMKKPEQSINYHGIVHLETKAEYKLTGDKISWRWPAVADAGTETSRTAENTEFTCLAYPLQLSRYLQKRIKRMGISEREILMEYIFCQSIPGQDT